MILHKYYRVYVFLSYIIYIIALFGINIISPEYIGLITSIIKICISFIIIYTFNPLKHKSVLTPFEKDLIFFSGISLLLTTFIGDYLLYKKHKIENKIKNKIKNKTDNN